METIAKEFGVKRYGWLVYMDKKAKEEVKRQKEVIKGDPAIRKLSRKERRKASQIERERDREAGRITGTKVLHHENLDEVQPMKLILAPKKQDQDRAHIHHHTQGVVLVEGILMKFTVVNQGLLR
ncbi:CLK4-ASSOCIATING SERINE/ARGININE RICH PROTEIN [Salix koriyanagi]|uniref:CLK4-ASSOCIATING SERINE/ARGININE RICH PROTEIN n=1 Tax=Salix koriyanagi TaxID=2511006 RepID=A0A9Q0P5G3_9ROSI|nr:CLK4-ASSOCIATING SERINE/ARGININE RICH PROTEIN [Salix koriyanagi]